MAQLIEAYSDPQMEHLPPLEEATHYTEPTHDPLPPMLNDTTLDPIVDAFFSIAWLSWLKTLLLFFLVFLLVRQVWRLIARFNAQRQRRNRSKNE